MNEQLNLVETESATATTLCAHCAEPFERRSGSGGRPQKFCSEECRRKAQRAPTPDAVPDVGGTPQADEQTPTVADVQKRITGSHKPDYLQHTWDFDWVKADCIVLREQRDTAIYWNPHGNLVIHQRADWDESNDPFLVICAKFIDRLCDIAGIGGAVRRD
jgi:hypothetical protein